MKRILIVIGDNDFMMTMKAFAHLLTDYEFFDPEIKRNHRSEPFTKADIVRLWNLAAPGLYAMAQNRVGPTYSKDETWEDHVKRIGGYLQITEKKIFIDEEIDEFLKDYFCNGEAILMDWRNPSQPPFVTII